MPLNRKTKDLNEAFFPPSLYGLSGSLLANGDLKSCLHVSRGKEK